MRLLVIDDDVDVREMICKMLTGDDYDLLVAANGKEGMQIIKREPEIDIVITDLIMPEMEGIETIQEIKRRFPQIKILAISGGGRGSAQNYLTLAKGMGANLTLNKPFVKNELLNALKEITEVK